jgi:MFS family permease
MNVREAHVRYFVIIGLASSLKKCLIWTWFAAFFNPSVILCEIQDSFCSRFGRKRTLMCSLVLQICLAVITAFSPWFELYLVLRCFLGFISVSVVFSGFVLCKFHIFYCKQNVNVSSFFAVVLLTGSISSNLQGTNRYSGSPTPSLIP